MLRTPNGRIKTRGPGRNALTEAVQAPLPTERKPSQGKGVAITPPMKTGQAATNAALMASTMLRR